MTKHRTFGQNPRIPGLAVSHISLCPSCNSDNIEPANAASATNPNGYTLTALGARFYCNACGKPFDYPRIVQEGVYPSGGATPVLNGREPYYGDVVAAHPSGSVDAWASGMDRF